MAKRKADDPEPEYGFRVLRNRKEFSPHGRSIQLVLQEVDAPTLFNKAQRRQLRALDSEQSDELVPVLQHRLRPRPLRTPSLVPLTTLLEHVIPPPPDKRRRVSELSASPSTASLSGAAKKRAFSKASYRDKRAVSRAAKQRAGDTALKEHVERRLAAVETTTVSDAVLALRRSSWTGPQRRGTSSVKVYSNTEVLRLSGLRLIKWDGRESRLLATRTGHRLMVLHARPKNWEKNMVEADQRLEWMYEWLTLDAAHLDHRRGKYPTLPAGYGYGGGRTEPGSYVNTPHNAQVLQEALNDPALQNVARYVDQGLLQHFPKLHAVFTNLDQKIVEVDNPSIKRAFAGCCYPALHFNLHKAATVRHADFMNTLIAMCGTYSSGLFDHTRGGHFIAWELGVIVEFPAGTAVYVPSASVEHENTPVGDGEHRSSMAFFVPAGLLRWYHNGFMSDKEFKERAGARQLKAWQEYRERLWDVGLDWLHYPARA